MKSGMLEPVQSPVISTALRHALALDGAGPIPLEFQGTIIPVAIVADVRAVTTVGPQQYWGHIQIGGISSQYARVTLDFSGDRRGWLGAALHKIILVSSFGQTVVLGYPQGEPLSLSASGNVFNKAYQQSNQSGVMRLRGGNNLAAPNIPAYAQNVYIPALVPLELTYDPPLILNRVGAAPGGPTFVAATAAAATDLTVSFEWSETSLL